MSMLENLHDASVDIIIFESGDVTDDDRTKLRSIAEKFDCTMTFVDFAGQFAGAFEIRGISAATYYRLRIPWILAKYDKVIYIDGDTIIKGNVKDLYDIEIGEALVAGFPIAAHANLDQVKKWYGHTECEAEDYINAGVLVVNSRKWREMDLYKNFEEHLNRKYTFQDQDILNIVCKGQKYYLPARYNLSPLHSEESVRTKDISDKHKALLYEAIASPCIIHFAGSKPWKTFTYYWTDWCYVYKRSPFFDKSLERTIANSILHPVYSNKRLISFFIQRNFPFFYKWIARLIRG